MDKKLRIKYFVPSYKRPVRCRTQELYPIVKLVVRESDKDEYIKGGNDIVVVPDKAQGNVCRIKNWILDNFLDNDPDCDAIVIMDDDHKWISRWNGMKREKLTNDEFVEQVENCTQMCIDWGLKMWGMNSLSDKQNYREAAPFLTLGFVGSPFTCHIKGSGLRYDESLSLKEDYDMTLQQISKWGGALRVNFLTYDVNMGMSGSGQTGGCSTYRNMEEEMRQFKLLEKKWGSKVVKRDTRSKRSFDTNPKLYVPLRGV